jgi:hypothetical protein
MRINTQPGAAGYGIDARQRRHRPVKDSRRLTAARVKLLAVRPHDHRSILDYPKKQSQ